MSGIAGLLQFQGPVERGTLARFTDALAHRGPDGRGLLLDGALGLGHRRRALLGPGRRGRGPMGYEDSQPVALGAKWRGRLAAFGADGCEDAALTPYRYWLTFDGELHNFLELRRELAAMGYHFRTETDTEVVLAAYAQWGEACLRRFNGSWAFALWDRQTRTLFLARDHFGIKPLYYQQTAERFAFASELKAFLALDGFQPALNAGLVPALLENADAIEGTTDETVMAGVKRVPAGHTLHLTADGTAHMRRWWETRDYFPTVPARYEDQVARFSELLLDSVRLRLRSDIPIGTCLSGELGSSAVAVAMAQLHREKATDLTRCTTHWKQSLLAEFPDAVPSVRADADEIAQHLGAKPARWRFDPANAAAQVVESAWSLEDVGPDLVAPAWSLYRELGRTGARVSLEGHGADALLGGHAAQLDWTMLQVNDTLYREFHGPRWPALLRNLDRCAMAHGVAVRLPFLDWRLVAFAHALPAASKFGGGQTQRVLRDALAGLLPDRVRLRRREPRFAPWDAGWGDPALAALVATLVQQPRWLDTTNWNGPELRALALARSADRKAVKMDPAQETRLNVGLSLTLWEMLFVERTDRRSLAA